MIYETHWGRFENILEPFQRCQNALSSIRN